MRDRYNLHGKGHTTDVGSQASITNNKHVYWPLLLTFNTIKTKVAVSLTMIYEALL